MGFGHKQGWLAIGDATAATVLPALGLRSLGPVSWRDGMDLAYLTDDRLLVTPPLPGAGGRSWLLVAGRWLLDPSTVDVVALSDRLATEVQRFATYRVGELHAWERAAGGSLRRAFAYAGQTVTRWVGEPDAVERAAGLPASLDDPDSLLIAESDVLRVAAGWSIDPSRLDETGGDSGHPPQAPTAAAVDPTY